MIKLKSSLKSIVLTSSLLITSIIFIGCLDNNNNNNNNQCISGEGTEVTNTINVNDFSGINSSISSDIIITQGDIQEIKLIGHPNIIDKIKTEVVNNILEIDFENGCYNDFNLAIEITIPDISSIEILGSGGVVVEDFMNQSTLLTSITGSGNIKLNDFENILTFNGVIKGSGNVTINEKINVNDVDIKVTGSGNFKGFNLISNTANVSITGSGNTELTTINHLNISITGSGNVSYKGSPSINQDIVGSGSIKNSSN